MATELSYLADSESGYVRTFRARVTALPPGAVVLDRTFFYPVGGGQPADRGTLRSFTGEEWPIADVAKNGDSVLHRLGRRHAGGRGPSVGLEVEGLIDWDRRYRHMRLHTAQHLLSARVFALTGRRTARARLEGLQAFLDLEPGPAGSDVVLDDVTADFQAYVDRNLPVRIRQLSRAEYDREPGARTGLVALPSHVDPVRVVEIEAADRCPCGGTHLRATGEIGGFKLHPLAPLPEGGSRLNFTLAAPAPSTPSG